MTRETRRGSWYETAALVTLASAVLLLIARAAFRAYFFGETFLYLGQYWGQHERFWRALLSPSDVVFFKPVCFAASLPWYFLLPLDPWWYHARNFAFSVVNLVLLHRISLRLVPSRWARGLALVFFAVSKVHLTTIGYIMVFDSILMLTLLLLTVLCALRWCAGRSTRDYAAALFFCGLCAFTKDYAVAAVAVLLAVVAHCLIADAPRRWLRPLMVWLVPLALLAVLRVGLRYAIAGPMPWWHPAYAPRFSLAEVAWKGVVFLSALTNVSVGWHEKTGASAWGTVLASRAPTSLRASLTFGAIQPAESIDAMVGLGLAALIVATALAARRRWRELVVPAFWVVAFFVPPLLTRNVQIYYAYESLAGAAVLLGVALAQADRRLLLLWSVAIAAIGLGGAASNDAASYDWQSAANSARKIERPVLEAYRGEALRSLTFVTSDVPFWRWVLTADDKAPMLQVLLGQPGLPVRVMDRRAVADAPHGLDRAHVVLDADADFDRIRLETR